MLSYQHGYHAGNFADVHKHAIYALVLDYLLAKPKPLACMDLYAGRGAYDLRDAMAHKTGEAAQGIFKLWSQPWPELLGKWRAVLEQVGGPNLRAYPGSPLLAAKLLREQDRLVFNELHPAEHRVLAESVRYDSRAHLHRRPALEALPALVPPVEKRGVVLLDPAYEVKTEYAEVAEAVSRALRQWSSGTFMVWYPLLPEKRHRVLVDKLLALTGRHLLSELVVGNGGEGMYGSGMIVLNPPFVLADQLRQLAPFFAPLGVDGPATLRVDAGPEC